MQREGAVPDSSVQNKMTRIASLDQSTKHLELLARQDWNRCLNFAFCFGIGAFQHHQIAATDSLAIEGLACFAIVFDIDHGMAWTKGGNRGKSKRRPNPKLKIRITKPVLKR
jgi:hypothetical protein